MFSFKLTGLVAAPFTPFHQDGSLNLDMVPTVVDSLIENGVTGAFVCGTTGEGMSLTLNERMTVAEKWVDYAAKRLKVVVHVGHTSLSDSQELAAHAEQIGADAVSSMAPCFFRPTSAQDLVDSCALVAAAAPETPFYYYHIPSMTGVALKVLDFLSAATHIPNLVGVKFTHWDLMDFGRSVSFQNGRYNILFGRDEYMLSGLSLGAKGVIGSTYCYAAPLYHRLFAAFAAGDLQSARREQNLAAEMVATFAPYSGLPAQKAMMKMVGIDCGPVRLPLRALSREKYSNLREDLDQLGFFTRCIR